MYFTQANYVSIHKTDYHRYILGCVCKHCGDLWSKKKYCDMSISIIWSAAWLINRYSFAGMVDPVNYCQELNMHATKSYY